MIDIFKEIWFKWRAKVYEGKITKLSNERLGIKTKQLECKAKQDKYQDIAKTLGTK